MKDSCDNLSDNSKLKIHMLKFSQSVCGDQQPTRADQESLIIWLEYVVTTRQSFGLEIILHFNVRAPGLKDRHSSTDSIHTVKQSDTLETVRDYPHTLHIHIFITYEGLTLFTIINIINSKSFEIIVKIDLSVLERLKYVEIKRYGSII